MRREYAITYSPLPTPPMLLVELTNPLPHSKIEIAGLFLYASTKSFNTTGSTPARNTAVLTNRSMLVNCRPPLCVRHNPVHVIALNHLLFSLLCELLHPTAMAVQCHNSRPELLVGRAYIQWSTHYWRRRSA